MTEIVDTYVADPNLFRTLMGLIAGLSDANGHTVLLFKKRGMFGQTLPTSATCLLQMTFDSTDLFLNYKFRSSEKQIQLCFNISHMQYALERVKESSSLRLVYNPDINPDRFKVISNSENVTDKCGVPLIDGTYEMYKIEKDTIPSVSISVKSSILHSVLNTISKRCDIVGIGFKEEDQSKKYLVLKGELNGLTTRLTIPVLCHRSEAEYAFSKTYAISVLTLIKGYTHLSETCLLQFYPEGLLQITCNIGDKSDVTFTIAPKIEVLF